MTLQYTMINKTYFKGKSEKWKGIHICQWASILKDLNFVLALKENIKF